MNIKILDSWLREYLKTKANAKKISECLSLTSVSIERLEKYNADDFIYDIEITTNRPDLMSIIGLAREAAAVLPQFDIDAKFLAPKYSAPQTTTEKLSIKITNDPKLVNRIIAVIMDVDVKDSPASTKNRLEASGIRSLNNLIDVTNYVMRETGHPAHVFDYDRLTTKTLIVRPSKKGEKITTLDGKTHILEGGDIVADNGKGEIIDLLGIMGTANSIVTSKTRRILYFIDNNDKNRIRKTSMSLGIRSEAAILNEKGIDPELSMQAMLRGIELFQKNANGKMLSNIIDIYPEQPKIKNISISQETIDNVIGVKIPIKVSRNILEKLGFEVNTELDKLKITVPTIRSDVEIEEDIIEEVARVYGFHKLPTFLPPLTASENYSLATDPFYWEKRIKDGLKYWGFTEAYTYSMVSENLLEGPIEEALSIANPLTKDLIYLRKTLIPSLLQVVRDNPAKEDVRIFELANAYIPRPKDLPKETLMLSGIIKKPKVSFFEIKGIIEQLLNDVNIKNLIFERGEQGGFEVDIKLQSESLGNIEILDENIADFEFNFEIIKKHANLTKIYRGIPKYPPIVEDLSLIADGKIKTIDIVDEIKNQSSLVVDVSLLDQFESSKTFHIIYQDENKNLTGEEVAKIREKILKTLKEKFNTTLKE